MPTLHIRHPDGAEEELELGGELTVGRADGNDLVLPEGGVSRRHARLYLEGEAVWAEDLGSANGTWLDGERLDGPTLLAPEQTLFVGDYELRLRAPKRRPASSRRPAAKRGDDPMRGVRMTDPSPRGRSSTAMVERVPASRPRSERRERGPGAGSGAAPAAIELRGLTGPWTGKRFPLEGRMTLGRSPGVDILIEDDSVSRRHAELEFRESGIFVRDLGSANGTHVNGVKSAGKVQLEPGDVLGFGVVELILEDPSRPETSRRRGPSGAPKTRWLFLAVIALLIVAFSWVLVQLFASSPVPPDGRLDPQSLGAPVPTSPAARLQALISECRSFSATDLQDPEWDKAEAACDKALDIDPINDEANQLVRRLKAEKDAWQIFEKAERAMTRLREEEALELFRQLPADSAYYRRAKPRVKAAITNVKKRAGEDCHRYARSGAYAQALGRCEVYMSIACQTMKDSELYAPPGRQLKLSGRLKKGDWRPKSEMYLRFLEVRGRSAPPGTPPWRCEPSPIYDLGQEADEPGALLKKSLIGRYSEPALRKALATYWEGNATEAAAVLAQLREDVTKAQYHAEADELRRDIVETQNLYKTGQVALQMDELERAAGTFREALQLDEKLMRDDATANPSSTRRNIQQDVAAAAYRLGKHWADRQDAKRGCALWKIGFSFFQGNTDLNRAAHYCSTQATKALEQAGSCEALGEVLAYAVPGDGMESKVTSRKAEAKCP